MSHVVEVDQSGKVEDTKEDTVLAFANGMKFSVLIPATVKRDCVRILRQRGLSPKVFYLQLFVVGLFFLLKDHIAHLSHTIIDREYLGKDKDIRLYLMNLLKRARYTVDAEQFHFGHIGKGSTAHSLAIDTLRRMKQPDVKLTLEDILGQFEAKKKSGSASRQ
jgi:hypothetical protein